MGCWFWEEMRTLRDMYGMFNGKKLASFGRKWGHGWKWYDIQPLRMGWSHQKCWLCYQRWGCVTRIQARCCPWGPGALGWVGSTTCCLEGAPLRSFPNRLPGHIDRMQHELYCLQLYIIPFTMNKSWGCMAAIATVDGTAVSLQYIACEKTCAWYD